MNDREKHHYCTNKFIKLANELRKEDIAPSVVSAALMTASSVYATYSAAGNNGVLQESGVEKVMAVYRRTLEEHQAVKKAQLLEKEKEQKKDQKA